MHSLDDANRTVEKAGTVPILIEFTFHWITPKLQPEWLEDDEAINIESKYRYSKFQRKVNIFSFVHNYCVFTLYHTKYLNLNYFACTN